VAIVIGVIVLLGAAYSARTIHKEKEQHYARAAALKDNLASMRKAIARFRETEGRYPRTLPELVPKYLRRIPTDPVTNKAEWRLETEETVQPSTDFTEKVPATASYVIDVRSTAGGKDADGVPFSTY
jgi:general secretion pathway protein G